MSFNHFTYETGTYNSTSAEILVPLFIELLNPRSVLDVGCGKGDFLNQFMLHGIKDVIGIDGSHINGSILNIPLSNFRSMDLETDFDLKRRFDLCLCLEVAEHIDPDKSESFISNLVQHADTVIFSAAIPGQGGDMHINEQPPQYWQSLFERKGFKTCDVFRPLIWDNANINWWYRQNLFLATTKPDFASSGTIRYYIHPELYHRKIALLSRSNEPTITDLPRLFAKSLINSFWKKQ